MRYIPGESFESIQRSVISSGQMSYGPPTSVSDEGLRVI